MNADRLKELTQIRDVVLWSSTFVQPRDYLEYTSLQPQSRQSVDRCETYVLVDDQGKERSMLRAYCEFALRALGTSPHGGDELEHPSDNVDDTTTRDDESALPVLFQIEAVFALVFELKDQFPEEYIDTFFKKSCTHICWAFWRQHVFDILKRASLPLVPVPLMCPPKETTEGKQRSTRSKSPPPKATQISST